MTAQFTHREETADVENWFPSGLDRGLDGERSDCSGADSEETAGKSFFTWLLLVRSSGQLVMKGIMAIK